MALSRSTFSMARTPKPSGFALREIVVVMAVMAALPLIAWFVYSFFFIADKDSTTILDLVERRDFVHEITESGNVESGNNVEIRCQVEAKGGGGSTILEIVPEGTQVPVCREVGEIIQEGDIIIDIIDGKFVKKGDAKVGDIVKEARKVMKKDGDIVVKLDSSALEQDMLNQEIICNKSEAKVIGAQNVYDTAVLAKKEYLGEGEIIARYTGVVKFVRVEVDQTDRGLEEVVTPDAEILILDAEGRELKKHELPAGAILRVGDGQQVEPGILLGKLTPGTHDVDEQKIEHEIIDGREGLDRAEDYFQYSKRLEAKGYVTALELRADKFAVKKAHNTLASAKARLASLQKFTKRKNVGELDANIKTAEATLKAEQASHELDIRELKRVKEQVVKCIIRTPQVGQVVYANISRRHGSDTVIDEGEKVRENQVIIKLPDTTQMQVDCKINEAKVTLVEEGMPVTIKLDAFPEMELKGRVKMVNELPEPTGWFTTGAKEYKTIIQVVIDPGKPPPGLRPGLTAQVKILVERLSNVLQVSAQAVFEDGGKYYCLTEKKGKFQAHEVQIGSTNDEFVVIRGGLAEGQEIVLHAAAYRDKVVIKTLVEQVGDALRVPVEAVLEHGKKNYCITEKNGRFKAREVQIGPADDESVTIREGLTEGQEVVLHAAAYHSKVNLPKLTEEEKTTPKAGSPKPKTPKQAPATKPPGQHPGKKSGPPDSTSQRRKPGGDPFVKFDKNSDGKLVESEVPAGLWSMLKAADKNGDAAIDRAEMTAAMSKMRQRGGGRPGAGGGGGGGGSGGGHGPGAKP